MGHGAKTDADVMRSLRHWRSKQSAACRQRQRRRRRRRLRRRRRRHVRRSRCCSKLKPAASSSKSTSDSEEVLRLRAELEKTRCERLLAEQALLDAKKKREEATAKRKPQGSYQQGQWQYQKKHGGHWRWHTYQPGSEGWHSMRHDGLN